KDVVRPTRGERDDDADRLRRPRLGEREWGLKREQGRERSAEDSQHVILSKRLSADCKARRITPTPAQEPGSRAGSIAAPAATASRNRSVPQARSAWGCMSGSAPAAPGRAAQA